MRRWLMWQTQDKDMLRTSSTTLQYNGKELCKLGFYTRDILVGQWLGLLLTSEGECHWFLNGKVKGSVPVRDFPLDQPMWGVVELFGVCEQVKAETCTGKPPLTVCSYYCSISSLQCPSILLTLRGGW